MAAGLTIQRDRLEAFRERFGDVARQTLAPEDLGPEQRVDLEIDLARGDARARAALPLPRALRAGKPEPGVRRPRRALHRPERVGNGHLKGVLDDGTTELAAIGFQWADRVPWLGDGAGGRGVPHRVQRVEWHAARCRRGWLSRTDAGQRERWEAERECRRGERVIPHRCLPPRSRLPVRAS